MRVVAGFHSALAEPIRKFSRVQASPFFEWAVAHGFVATNPVNAATPRYRQASFPIASTLTMPSTSWSWQVRSRTGSRQPFWARAARCDSVRMKSTKPAEETDKCWQISSKAGRQSKNITKRSTHVREISGLLPCARCTVTSRS